MAIYYGKRYFHLLVIALLALILGVSNAHPKHVDAISTVEIEARSSLTSLEADSSNIIVRQGPDPGQCNSGEVLQYSECQCYNLVTSYCWSSSGGTFGQTNTYKAACPIGTQCMPSIGNSWTASCVDSSQVATLNVPASSNNCTTFSFTGYGPIQVVSQIVGGCPPTGSAYLATYYAGNSVLSQVYPDENYWLSGSFQAGPAVEQCVTSNSQAISLVSAFTGEITTPCTWCS